MPTKIICPKCKSQNSSPNLSGRSIAIGTFQHESKCNNCGYEGIFPEVEMKKEISAKNKK